MDEYYEYRRKMEEIEGPVMASELPDPVSPSGAIPGWLMTKLANGLTRRLPKFHAIYKMELAQALSLWQLPWAIQELKDLVEHLEEEYAKKTALQP